MYTWLLTLIADDPSLLGVKTLCKVTYTVSERQARGSAKKVKPEGNGQEHYTCDLVFEIHANPSTFEFSVLFKDKRVGSVQTKYVES